MRPSPQFRTPALLPLVALLFLAGCTRVGGGAGPAAGSERPEPVRWPDVSGTWSGYVTVEGEGLDGTLRIQQDGPVLGAVFEAAALGLVAEGEGRIAADGSLRITLGYDLQCPGNAELEGRRAEDGLVLEGTLTASDCTGTTGGSFTFRR